MGDPLPAIGLLIVMAGFTIISSLFSSLVNGLYLLSSDRELILTQKNSSPYKYEKYVRYLNEHVHLYSNICRAGIIMPLIGIGLLVEPVDVNQITLWLENLGINEKPAGWICRAMVLVFVTSLYIICCSFAPKILLKKFQEHCLLHRDNKLNQERKEHSLLSQNILEFSTRTAREIMIPRTEMICLNTDLTIHDNLKIASIEMRTRYPVCTGDKDHIIGFVHIKDLFMSGIEDYAATIRPILSVPESTSIDLLLKQMKDAKTQISIVIDEYGGTSGLVTLEDIVEEIVGEIQDEFDNERPLVEYLGDDTYSVDGLMLIEELNHHLHLSLEDTPYDTLGGWLFSELDSFPPQKGDYIINGSYQYCIEEMEHLRISRILLIRQHVTTEQTGT